MNTYDQVQHVMQEGVGIDTLIYDLTCPSLCSFYMVQHTRGKDKLHQSKCHIFPVGDYNSREFNSLLSYVQ